MHLRCGAGEVARRGLGADDETSPVSERYMGWSSGGISGHCSGFVEALYWLIGCARKKGSKTNALEPLIEALVLELRHRLQVVFRHVQDRAVWIPFSLSLRRFSG